MFKPKEIKTMIVLPFGLLLITMVTTEYDIKDRFPGNPKKLHKKNCVTVLYLLQGKSERIKTLHLRTKAERYTSNHYCILFPQMMRRQI